MFIMQIYFSVCALVLIGCILKAISMRNLLLVGLALVEVPIYVCAYLYLFQ